MNDLFLQLCAGVAAAMEFLKPTIKRALNITTNTDAPVYQGAVWLVAALVGIAGAFAFQVDVTPTWINLPDAAGFVFTGVVSAFGSEIAHRILEVIEAISTIFQNRAAKAA